MAQMTDTALARAWRLRIPGRGPAGVDLAQDALGRADGVGDGRLRGRRGPPVPIVEFPRGQNGGGDQQHPFASFIHRTSLALSPFVRYTATAAMAEMLPRSQVIDYSRLCRRAPATGVHGLIAYLRECLPPRWKQAYQTATSDAGGIVLIQRGTFLYMCDVYSGLENLGEVPFNQTRRDRVIHRSRDRARGAVLFPTLGSMCPKN
jgi:hypothetical protein